MFKLLTVRSLREVVPWLSRSLEIRQRFKNFSSEWEINSLPCSSEKLSSIGIQGKVWTRWNSLKLKLIWMVRSPAPSFLAFLNKQELIRLALVAIDLVSEYQQYQEASVDDEEGEEGVEEEQEVRFSRLSSAFSQLIILVDCQ